MSQGLYDPLGAANGRPLPRRGRPVALVTGALAAALVALGLFVTLRGGGDRGEPSAVVPIERPPVAVAPVQPAPPPVAAASPPAPPASTARAGAEAAPGAGAASGVPAVPDPLTGLNADVEIQNGVRIIRMRQDPTGATAQVPKAATVPTGSAGPHPNTRTP